ncbi:MAG: hypothetical protein A2322_06910, partial [Bacteroidetes bacterium RIFOXYB2_FULL_39_7]
FEEILFMVNNEAIITGPILILKSVQYLSPLIFYLCVEYYTNPDYKIWNKTALYLVFPFIALVLAEYTLANHLKVIKVTFLLIYCFICILLSLLLLKRHKRHIRKFASNTAGINLNWLEFIIWFVLFLIVIVGIYNLTYFDAPLNVYMNVFIYIIIILTAYYSLKQKEIYPLDASERTDVLSVVYEEEHGIVQNKLIPDERLDELKSQLNDLISKEELFLDSDLSLGKLARYMNISPHHLSYVINNGFNLNFYSYINTFRVEKAKNLLVNRELDRYSLIGIAYESGFNSKTSFNTMFKKLTGQTPSQFKKTRSG